MPREVSCSTLLTSSSHQAGDSCGEGCFLSIRVCSARRKEFWRARVEMCGGSIPESPAGRPGEQGVGPACFPPHHRWQDPSRLCQLRHPGAAQPFAPGSVSVQGVSWPSSALIGSAGVGGMLFHMYPKYYLMPWFFINACFLLLKCL